MPLEPGKSKQAFSRNVKTEVAAGKPQRQAVAIAYRKSGRDVAMSNGPVDVLKRAIKAGRTENKSQEQALALLQGRKVSGRDRSRVK